MVEFDGGTTAAPGPTALTEKTRPAEEGEVTGFSAELTRLVEERLGRISEDIEDRCAQHVAEAKHGFLEDAVLLHDRIATCRRDVVGMFDGLERECEELLRRAGLVLVEVTGDDFDPSVQRAVGTAPAPSPELDGKVARKVRCGVLHEDGRVFRPENVIVYREGAQDEQR